jgi:hypothetical protein
MLKQMKVFSQCVGMDGIEATGKGFPFFVVQKEQLEIASCAKETYLPENHH